MDHSPEAFKELSSYLSYSYFTMHAHLVYTQHAIYSSGRWLEASTEVSVTAFSLITGNCCGKRLYHLLGNLVARDFIYLCKVMVQFDSAGKNAR